MVLWFPLLFHQGYVFERDPSFYATIHADTAWSFGEFSFQGGINNVGSQGIFYEPYAAVIWLISHLGIPIDAATWSKLIPFLITGVAAGGAFSLARKYGAGFAGSCFASLFYVFNPWSLDCFGYFYYWTGYCLLPFLILGTIRIRKGEKTPYWLPIAFLFLGGLISWVIGAVVCTLVAATNRRGGQRSFSRTMGRLGIAFLGAGAFWIFPYLFTLAFPSAHSLLTYASTGPPLESPNPVTNLLELRDFWWPHLDLSAYAGIVPLAISTFSVVALVLTAIWHITVGSARDSKLEDATDHREMLGSLLVVGLVLGAGTAGATGWIIKLIRDWPFFGNNIIRSLTREPARLASPFVAALAIALALAITSFASKHENHALRFGVATNSLMRMIGAFIVLGVACAPSLLSFWGTYQPVQIPSTYNDLSNNIPKGTSLEIAYWPPGSVLEPDGVSHFVWSNRAVSDANLLAASVRSPSVSPLVLPVRNLDQLAETSWSNKAGVARLEALAQKLGITSFVVELDIQLPNAQRTQLNTLVSSLHKHGLPEKNLGTEIVFRIPSPVRTPIWSRYCKTNDDLFFAGFVHVDCDRDTSIESVISPFELPTPVYGVGVHISNPVSVDGIGTKLLIASGNSGWIIFLPNLFVTIGGLTTILFAFAVGTRTAATFVQSKYRRRAPNDSQAPGD